MDSQLVHTSQRRTKLLVFALVALLVIVLDQLSKYSIVRMFELNPERQPFIPGLLDLLLVHNEGAAFSIGIGAGPIFVVVALVLSLGALVFLWTYPQTNWMIVLCLAAVIGGGLANMIDRIRFGYVIDFLATSFIDFPVFNVADMFVSCGMVLLVITVFVMGDRLDDNSGDGRQN